MRLSAMVRSVPFSAVAVVAFLLLVALFGGASTLGKTQSQHPVGALSAGGNAQSTELVSTRDSQGHGDGCGLTCLPACAGIDDDCVGGIPVLSTVAAERGSAIPTVRNDSGPSRPQLVSQRERPTPSLVLLSINRT